MKYAIIGDRNETRAGAFKAVLERRYDLLVNVELAWNSVEIRLQQPRGPDEPVEVVFLDYGLPGPEEGRRTLLLRVGYLRMAYEFGLQRPIVVTTDNPKVSLPFGLENDSRLLKLGTREGTFDEEELVAFLDKYLQHPKLEIVLPRRDRYRQLWLQLRFLDGQGREEVIREILGWILWKFRKNCTKAKVHRLTQGFSGSLVLRVEMQEKDEVSMRVLKVSHLDDLWKVRRVGQHWDTIAATLNYAPIANPAPPPFEAEDSISDCPTLVQVNCFVAELWPYLGDRAGKFVDLESAYLSGKPAAEEVIGNAMKQLGDAWYDHALVSPKGIALWEKDDARYPDPETPPPYRLSAWSKARIVGSLQSLDVLGRRLFGRTAWDNAHEQILKWLEKGPGENTLAARAKRVVTSKIHGDLNMNNVFYTEKAKWTFFIDFATFQPDGHSVYDFALLETQVKFGLMDREYSSDLRAFDYTVDRFDCWLELEDELLAQFPAETERPVRTSNAATLGDGIQRAGNIIRCVRDHAARMHAKAIDRSKRRSRKKRSEVSQIELADVSSFLDEYAAALLFLTLREITYDNTRSPFKRLLAVHSAYRITEYLGAAAP